MIEGIVAQINFVAFVICTISAVLQFNIGCISYAVTDLLIAAANLLFVVIYCFQKRKQQNKDKEK